MVKGVFFDVGSTLLFPSPSVAETFTEVAVKRGSNITIRDVEPHMPAVDAYYDREYERDGDFWCSHDRSVQIWLDMYALLARLVEVEDDHRELSHQIYDCYKRAAYWGVYEDVHGCLMTLKRSGYRLGIISNWDAGLEDLIRDLGMLPYFDVVVSSASVGYRKPDSAIFEIALDRMGLPAHEAVHVGDLPEADGAAAAVGMMPVIIDRNARYEACGFARLSSLTDLPSFLEGLSLP